MREATRHRIDWACPTSVLADHYNRGEGCFLAETLDDSGTVVEIVGASESLDAAREMGRATNLPQHPRSY